MLISPTGGYNGSSVFTLTVPSGAPTICYAMEYGGSTAQVYAVPVTGITQATLLIGVGSTVCGSVSTNPYWKTVNPTAQKASLTPPAGKSSHGPVLLTTLAGLLVVGFGARRRKLPMLLNVALLTVVGLGLGLGLSGCSGSGTGTGETGTTTPTAATTTYTLTLTGTDSVSSSITSSTTFTLTL